jgi:hypothetical protein
MATILHPAGLVDVAEDEALCDEWLSLFHSEKRALIYHYKQENTRWWLGEKPRLQAVTTLRRDALAAAQQRAVAAKTAHDAMKSNLEQIQDRLEDTGNASMTDDLAEERRLQDELDELADAMRKADGAKKRAQQDVDLAAANDIFSNLLFGLDTFEALPALDLVDVTRCSTLTVHSFRPFCALCNALMSKISNNLCVCSEATV